MNGDSAQHGGEDSPSDVEPIAELVKERLEVAAKNSFCIASEANEMEKSPGSREDEKEDTNLYERALPSQFRFPERVPSLSPPPQESFAQEKPAEDWRTPFDRSCVTPPRSWRR